MSNGDNRVGACCQTAIGGHSRVEQQVVVVGVAGDGNQHGKPVLGQGETVGFAGIEHIRRQPRRPRGGEQTVPVHGPSSASNRSVLLSTSVVGVNASTGTRDTGSAGAAADSVVSPKPPPLQVARSGAHC